jgi:hypothetical protein
MFMTTTTEKRKHPRFEINQMVELTYARENFVGATGINISTNGLLCETNERMEPHTVVFMMITLTLKGKEYLIECEGVVNRSEKIKGRWNTAINITAVRSGDRKAFDSFASGLQ